MPSGLRFKNNFHKTLLGRNHGVPFRALSQRWFFQFLLPFLSANYLLVLVQLACWHTDQVVCSRDGCRHSVAEGTDDVPIRLLQQILSVRTALFSCLFA